MEADHRQRWRRLASRHRAIAVIRTSTVAQGIAMAQAVAQAGLHLIEITWNSEQPDYLIEHLAAALPDCTVGAGTLQTSADVERAIAVGAQFCFSPHTDSALIDLANQAGIPFIPGALTPTEIVRSWQAGAACVKVFPITAVGGAAYLRALRGPLGHIPLLPTGGVTRLNVADLLTSGAIAVGLSSALFPQQTLKRQDWPAITDNARELYQITRQL